MRRKDLWKRIAIEVVGAILIILFLAIVSSPTWARSHHA